MLDQNSLLHRGQWHILVESGDFWQDHLEGYQHRSLSLLLDHLVGVQRDREGLELENF